MTTRTWNGTNGNFTDAASWSPAGVPGPGDVAAINSGSVALSGTASGVQFVLTEAAGSTASTTLSLNGATLDSSSSLTVNNNQSTVTLTAPTINVSGASALNGTGAFYGTGIQFAIAAGSTLVNRGAMNFYGSSPTTTGGGTLENDNVIAFVNPLSRPQVPLFADAITGTGTIALGEHARVQFNGPVGNGQTVLLNDGASGDETVQLNSISTFGATINGFSQSDLLSVVNTPYTSATYTSTGSNSGTLSIFSNGALQGSVNFLGQYSLSSFNFTFNNFGGGQSNLQITTTAVNAQSGGLPPGYQNGGNGLPVYRWFDTKFGTHFFTADVGEAATVNATRSSSLPGGDLTPETNDFGAVSSTDPNAESVYRFFDTIHGTHFFTASVSERDTAINTRSDLTYEPNSTFFEHASQQAGDIPVYRFFDTQYGTHFYTGDAGEAQSATNLLIAGTNQHQFAAEGIGFYAPSGSYSLA